MKKSAPAYVCSERIFSLTTTSINFSTFKQFYACGAQLQVMTAFSVPIFEI